MSIVCMRPLGIGYCTLENSILVACTLGGRTANNGVELASVASVRGFFHLVRSILYILLGRGRCLCPSVR